MKTQHTTLSTHNAKNVKITKNKYSEEDKREQTVEITIETEKDTTEITVFNEKGEDLNLEVVE